MVTLAALVARWNALPARIRSLTLAGVTLAVVGAIAGGVLSHPARVTLFAAPLFPEQTNEVEERLAEWNVPFTPVSGNVVVDAGRRNDLLLKLALAGVPHAHVERSGEALANVGVLTPQSVIDAQARAGLAGDIEAGLRGIAGIDDAQVIVVPAKAAEFADETSRDGSASVRLRLRAGVQLDAQTVAGIRTYVAASVAGLDPRHVTLLDDAGVALGSATGARSADDLARALQSALDSAFGVGTTIVRVAAEYGAASVEERDDLRAPIGGAPIERTASGEQYAAAGKNYHRSAEVDRRGSDTRERFTQSAPGALVHLSTAVFVDRSRAGDLASIRALAAATVGFDPKRGDSIVVQAVDFAHARAPRRDAWWLAYGAIVPVLPALVVACALVAVARLALPVAGAALRGVVDRWAVERTGKAVAGYAPARVRSVLADEPPHTAAAIISALPAATAAAVLDLYPAHEREAIVRRMQRPHSPFLDEARELLNRHV